MNHETLPDPKEFSINDAEYEAFINYLSDKEYDYITKTEEKLRDFKDTAEKEEFWGAVRDQFTA